MSSFQQRVLDLIQSSFPIESDPYGRLADTLGASRDEVLAAVGDLRREGTIRRIGASFASKKLGYASSLCALAVEGGQDELDAAARIVNAYPNVTHNYQRDARYNLWFTVIARGEEAIGRILSEIREATGCVDALNLPATRLYKIRVDFGAQDGARSGDSQGTAGAGVPDAGTAAAAPPSGEAVEASAPFNPDDPFDVGLVRWAQSDIAGQPGAPDPEPFATAARILAAHLGDASIDEQRVIARVRQLKAERTIRRFGAMVAHRKMGYAFNGMTVWDVSAQEQDAMGKAFAAMPFVTHCYARPRTAAWPYNLYAMVHAKTREELEQLVAALEDIAGQKARVLLSSREYKKVSMRYFEEQGL